MSTAAGHRAATNEWTLWIVAAACAVHATEEYLTGWQTWARASLGIAMPTASFVLMNAVLVAAALFLARTGWRRPILALIIPSAALVNAVVFHILPTLIQSRVAPGLWSAAGLSLPVSAWALVGAARDGVARSSIGTAFLVGSIVAISVVLGARLLFPSAG